MRVKCYNLERVTMMLDIHVPSKIQQLEDFLNLLKSNNVEIFSPPVTPGSGRARKSPITYLKANKWLDEYMEGQNLFSQIKGKFPVKPGYRDYQ